MSTSIPEPPTTPQPTGAAQKQTPRHKARTAKSGKKTSSEKSDAKTGKAAGAGTRPGSKTGQGSAPAEAVRRRNAAGPS
jgi:hypothetical protein